jgi:hypothetical protein
MPRDLVSSKQFQMLADTINKGRGFSHKVAGSDKGYKAKHGYMVGMPGLGKDFPAGAVSATDLEGFAASQKDVLSESDVYMGGWQGENPKRGSVDVSRRFDRSESGLVSAREAASISNQEAIGEVGWRGGYVGDISNPNYVESVGHNEKSQLNLFEDKWIHTGVSDPAATAALRGAGKLSKAQYTYPDGRPFP